MPLIACEPEAQSIGSVDPLRKLGFCRVQREFGLVASVWGGGRGGAVAAIRLLSHPRALSTRAVPAKPTKILLQNMEIAESGIRCPPSVDRVHNVDP